MGTHTHTRARWYKYWLLCSGSVVSLTTREHRITTVKRVADDQYFIEFIMSSEFCSGVRGEPKAFITCSCDAILRHNVLEHCRRDVQTSAANWLFRKTNKFKLSLSLLFYYSSPWKYLVSSFSRFGAAIYLPNRERICVAISRKLIKS